MTERTDFVPSHVGDNVLPRIPLFTRLLTLGYRSHQSPAIKDINAGIEKTSADLITDAINLRKVLKAALNQDIIQDLQNGKEVFISILAPGGYEFAVGILAVLALGAAAKPFSIAQPVTEAAYYINKAKSVAVVVATSAIKLGNALAAEICKTTNPDFVAVPIKSYENGPLIQFSDILISSNRYLDPNGPGVVIFTSGTTGPPKGAVLRRAAITDGSMSFAQQLGLQESDVLLHLLPVHHATGIWVSFFPFIQTGACIEFRSGSFDPVWTWNRFKRGGLTQFSGVPTIYMRMMRYYQEHLTKLPKSELDKYRIGISNVRTCICGTSALPKPIDDFWTEIRQGRRIVQRYGSTETGVVFNMPINAGPEIPDGSVGEATLGVDIKLLPSSDTKITTNKEIDSYDEGEILVRSFTMFSKYLYDPAATRAAHDIEGYFRTGDMARRSGKYYFITGRASVDIIKSGGYKISALDIERELLSLPYIAEAMVVGVPDDEFGQRVAAVISLRTDEIALQFLKGRADRRTTGKILSLTDLRSDLRSRLAGYKLPTILRVVEGEIPKSATGKVVKKVLGPKYFPPDSFAQDSAVQIWAKSSDEVDKVKFRSRMVKL